MLFQSTNSPGGAAVPFRDAVLGCLPDDGGLYVPEGAIDLRQFLLYMDEETAFPELVATLTPALFEGELDPFAASRVAQSAFDFAPELVRLDDDFSLLNLYNGPTGFFNDFGTAYLAAAIEEMARSSGEVIVLAAARSDSGSSMAHAFAGRKGIYAVLVYPPGPIRGIDSAALFSNGGNILPIRVDGTFDDCQRLISRAILNRRFSGRYNVTSSNTINPGRLLPQVFYYIYAFIKAKRRLSGDVAFGVPCGNFGNLVAGLYAWKFGLPASGFVAAMNRNDNLGDFFRGRDFSPRPVVATNSPALDVGAPSNMSRLASFYRDAPAVMRAMVYPASVNDGLTVETMGNVRRKYRRHVDPHTAVAFAAAERIAEERKWKGHTHTVVLATAHYAKDPGLVFGATGESVEVPQKLLSLLNEVEPAVVISPNVDAFEGIIANCF